MGKQLRPYIVWFGEEVPNLDRAIAEVVKADIVIIVGTSKQAYLAAGLVSFAREDIPVYFIVPKPAVSAAFELTSTLTVIETTAAQGPPDLVTKLTKDLITS